MGQLFLLADTSSQNKGIYTLNLMIRTTRGFLFFFARQHWNFCTMIARDLHMLLTCELHYGRIYKENFLLTLNCTWIFFRTF